MIGRIQIIGFALLHASIAGVLGGAQPLVPEPLRQNFRAGTAVPAGVGRDPETHYEILVAGGPVLHDTVERTPVELTFLWLEAAPVPVNEHPIEKRRIIAKASRVSLDRIVLLVVSKCPRTRPQPPTHIGIRQRITDFGWVDRLEWSAKVIGGRTGESKQSQEQDGEESHNHGRMICHPCCVWPIFFASAERLTNPVHDAQ